MTTQLSHRIVPIARRLVVAGAAVLVAGCATSSPRTVQTDARDALADARARLQEAPGDLDARWDVARHLEATGSPTAARAHLDSLLTAAPDHLGALSLWSKLQYGAGAHDAAVERLEGVSERLGGDLPDALRAGLALHYDALGRWEDSAREFGQLETPSSAKVYHVLRSDEFLTAADLAEAALAKEPESAASHNNFGITRLYAGDPEAAHAAFLRALDLDPDLSGAMYNLAIVETFYFFDEAAGRDWYAAYRATGSVDDPDGLAATFAWDDTSPVGEQARR